MKQATGVADQLEAACKELGLDDEALADALRQATTDEGSPNRAIIILAQANDRLRAELVKLLAGREANLKREQEIVELLGCKEPEKIVHDLRNMLNERMLLKALHKT